MKLRQFVALFLLLLFSAAVCGALLAQAGETPGLRALAEKRNFGIGAAVRPQALDEAAYAATLAREFNLMVSENHLKFGPVHPERDRFDFSGGDRLVAFAAQHGMKMRGHTLVWHIQQPKWLTEGNFSREEMKQILLDHIQTVVGRYKGKIYAWDVVNESVEKDGSWRETIWYKALGEEYLDLAFRAAHEADPAAKLYYNDFDNEGMNEKSDTIFKLVTGMKQRGVPVHGVGLQAHVHLDQPPDITAVRRNIQRLTQAGLDVEITEFDVRIPMPVTREKLEAQAKIYGDMLGVCLEFERCKSFLTWGFTDKYSWIPGWFKGTNDALPLDREYRPKPAYEAMREALVKQ